MDAGVVMRSALIMQHQGKLSEFRISTRPLLTFYIYLGFSKKNFDAQFVEQFASEMESYWNDPVYSALLKKYSQMITQ